MILDEILIKKRREIEQRKASRPEADLRHAMEDAAPVRGFAAALADCSVGPVRLIAEFKRASPSKGQIRDDLGPAKVARLYTDAGATAMSVLTDGPFFSGSLDDLLAAHTATELPIIRKDFILDRYQLLEARAAGADAVLLIAAALADEELLALHQEAAQFGLDALVEVHDEPELERVLATGARLIGINNRNLQTFQVDLATTIRLRPMIEPGITVVSESGIHSLEDVLRLHDADIDAILVGEFLMRRSNPAEAVRELLGIGAG